jgi:hypothetical protein
MKLGTHMPDGVRRTPIDIEVCRTKVKVTTSIKEQKLDTCFVSAQYLKNEMSDLNESWYTHARCGNEKSIKFLFYF